MTDALIKEYAAAIVEMVAAAQAFQSAAIRAAALGDLIRGDMPEVQFAIKQIRRALATAQAHATGLSECYTPVRG